MMMKKKRYIAVALIIVLFLGLVCAAWGLVYANAVLGESKRKIVDKAANPLASDTSEKSTYYDNITPLELKHRMDDESDGGLLILDIRDEASYEQGHITGAINIPLKELGYRLFGLDKTKDIIVYCRIGVQSKIACQILENAGFKDVYNLTGGLAAWNYPIETSDGRVNI
jgi:rhodanese-related sulfurtransferase